MLSKTLKLLLDYSKAKVSEDVNNPFDWKILASILGPFYHHDMKLVDVVRIILKAYEEAILEKRFEMPSPTIERILLAPIDGMCAIDHLGVYRNVDTKYSIEQFYNAMLTRLMNDLRFTRVDWMLDPVYISNKLGISPALLDSKENFSTAEATLCGCTKSILHLDESPIMELSNETLALLHVVQNEASELRTGGPGWLLLRNK